MPSWFSILKDSDDDAWEDAKEKGKRYLLREERKPILDNLPNDEKQQEESGAKKRFPNHTETYHVKSPVWEAAGLVYNDGTPTILELEELLGRRLVKDDFLLEGPLNWKGAARHSIVLDRITREGIIEGLRRSAETPYAWFPRTAPLSVLNNRKRMMEKYAESYGITLDFTNWDNRVELMSDRRGE